jgi:hypothetical protein
MADRNQPPLPDPAVLRAQRAKQLKAAQAVGGALGFLCNLPLRAVALTLIVNSEGLGVGSLASVPDLSFTQALGVVVIAVLAKRAL